MAQTPADIATAAIKAFVEDKTTPEAVRDHMVGAFLSWKSDPNLQRKTQGLVMLQTIIANVDRDGIDVYNIGRLIAAIDYAGTRLVADADAFSNMYKYLLVAKNVAVAEPLDQAAQAAAITLS